MLKRIRLQEVRIGMFIAEIEGSWVDNPFWRTGFLLKRGVDVQKLKSSSVDGVVIDTSRGLDIEAAVLERPPTNTRDSADLRKALRTIEQSRPLINEIFENARMGRAVSASGATQAVDEIADSIATTPWALIEVTRLKSKDEFTFLHSIAVSALMVHLSRTIKMEANAVRDLGIGGLLHDLGKMRIAPSVLNKKGPLTDREMIDIRRHPFYGYELLTRQGDMPQVVLDICLNHHERIDGMGYPNGLSKRQLSVPVRISSICDVYDALTSVRPYKKAWSPVDAAKFMFAQDGQFDKKLLLTFFHSLNI